VNSIRLPIVPLQCHSTVINANATHITSQAQLMAWSKAQGMMLDGVDVREGPLGRGLFLTRTVKKGGADM
jgi:hypothetical protein